MRSAPTPLHLAALAAALLVCACAQPTQDGPASDAASDPAHSPDRLSGTRPHIVLVMVDDLGFSDLGCYGSEIETPHLDALSAGGVRFAQFVNTARCCPTRASLMTGLQPHQVGIGHMTLPPGRQPDPDRPPAYQGHLNDTCTTVAEVLRAAGYATFMSGKWHLGMHERSDWPLQRGFDRFWGLLPGASNYFTPRHPRGIHDGNAPVETPASTTERRFYTTDAFTDHAIRFVEEHLDAQAGAGGLSGGAQPFFLYLAYTAPHWPLHAHDEEIARYRDRYRVGWDALRAERLARQRALGLIGADATPAGRDERVPAWETLDEARQEEMALRMAIYAAQIDRVDQNLGKLIGVLRDRGALDDTMLVFLADNGGCAEFGVFGNGDIHDVAAREASGNIAYGRGWANVSNTPFRLYKHWSHEGGTASPFLVHWPARVAPRAEWCRQPAQVLDLVPTLLDAAGASHPAGPPPLEGVSLLPALAGRPVTRTQPMFNEHENHGFARTARWKLVGLQVARPDGYHPERWELYDLRADRTETRDLAAERPDVVAELGDAWKAWADRVGVFPKPGR